MTLTPVEIRHISLPRRFFGYDRKTVDRLLEEITRSFEVVWRERADLGEDIERLESELTRYKELEVMLRNSLVSAERAADDVRAQARREADLVMQEARMRAREIAGGAEGERERVKAEIRQLNALEAEVRARYRAFLLTALDRIESDTDETPAPETASNGASHEAPEQAA